MLTCAVSLSDVSLGGLVLKALQLVKGVRGDARALLFRRHSAAAPREFGVKNPLVLAKSKCTIEITGSLVR